MKKVIHKNWHILKSDPVIGKEISERPKIIFRRAPNLRGQLTNSYIKEKEKKRFSSSGYHNCGKCKACVDSGILKQKRIRKEFMSQDQKNK